MVVDEISLNFNKQIVTVSEDSDGGELVGIWHIILLKRPPDDEPRRNGKVPKILTHRLFPRALYSIWNDGKMKLIVDPLLMLERFQLDKADPEHFLSKYLWRGKPTFAIAPHKHRHKKIYDEADSNNRKKTICSASSRSPHEKIWLQGIRALEPIEAD